MPAACLRKLVIPCLLCAAACGDKSPTDTTPSKPFQLVIIDGQNVVTDAGAEVALSVRAEDRAGRAVPDAAIAWAVEQQGDLVDFPGTLSSTATLTDAHGIATIKRFLGPTAGRYFTKAELFAVPQTTVHFSATAQVQGAFVMALAPTSNNNQVDTVLAAFAPYRVAVRDHRDLPVAGVRVRWFTIQGSGTLSGNESVTDGQGVAEVVFRNGSRSGTTVVEAQVAGLIGSPVSFRGRANPGIITTLTKIGGDEQIGRTGSALPLDYIVTGNDAYGNNELPNLIWTVVTGGGAIQVHANGTTARHVLGGSDGRQSVSVRTASGAANATFTSTAFGVVIYVQSDWYYGRAFSPSSVNVGPGKTVAWDFNNCGYYCYNEDHNITFEDDPQPPTSSLSKHSGYHVRTFNTPGTYRYRCTNHSTSFDDTAGMTGRIIVQ